MKNLPVISKRVTNKQQKYNLMTLWKVFLGTKVRTLFELSYGRFHRRIVEVDNYAFYIYAKFI
jgi:hypothetical protein